MRIISKVSYGSLFMMVTAGYNRVHQGTFTLAKAVCVVNNKFIVQMYVLVVAKVKSYMMERCKGRLIKFMPKFTRRFDL